MTSANRNIRIKKSQSKEYTFVTTVDGKPLSEVAPALKNEFENYSDAFKQVQKATRKRPNFLMTTRMTRAAYALRA